MTTLPTLNTAFPSIEPWLDVRSHLVRGWRSLGSQTFGILATQSSIMVSARLVADEATSWRIADALPFVGPQNLPFSASLDGQPISVELQRSTGNLYFSAPYRQMALAGELVISGVIPRGKKVS